MDLHAHEIYYSIYTYAFHASFLFLIIVTNLFIYSFVYLFVYLCISLMVMKGEESGSAPASVPHTITPSYVLARPQHLVEKQEGR